MKTINSKILDLCIKFASKVSNDDVEAVIHSELDIHNGQWLKNGKGYLAFMSFCASDPGYIGKITGTVKMVGNKEHQPKVAISIQTPQNSGIGPKLSNLFNNKYASNIAEMINTLLVNNNYVWPSVNIYYDLPAIEMTQKDIDAYFADRE